MSFDSIIAVTHDHYHPSVFFLVGLFMSMVLCVLAARLETLIRRGEFDSVDVAHPVHKYQRFQNELISKSRHVGFTMDEVHELEGPEFHPE